MVPKNISVAKAYKFTFNIESIEMPVFLLPASSFFAFDRLKYNIIITRTTKKINNGMLKDENVYACTDLSFSMPLRARKVPKTAITKGSIYLTLLPGFDAKRPS